MQIQSQRWFALAVICVSLSSCNGTVPSNATSSTNIQGQQKLKKGPNNVNQNLEKQSQTPAVQDKSKEKYDEAIAIVVSSKESAKSQSIEDIEYIASSLLSASDILKTVPKQSTYYNQSQKKISEYNKLFNSLKVKISTSNQKANNVSSSEASSQNLTEPVSHTQTTPINVINSNSPAASEIDSYALQGSFTLISSHIAGGPNNCYGSGGFDDVGPGMPVTIKDGASRIIATGQTEVGYQPDSKYGNVECIFSFNVDNIPKVDFYSIEIGRRGQINYSFDEMQRHKWKVATSLSG